MVLIEDLGMKPIGSQGYKKRFGLYECPVCNKHFECATDDVKSGHTTKCKGCVYKVRIAKAASEFIEKAKIIHGEAFDYSKVIYEKANKKVQIKCNSCGHTFFQKPNNHLVGKGCRICADLAMRNTQEEFEYRAKQIHGDIYNYTNTVYTTYHEPITIMCNTHGEFSTTPNMFLAGYGCPRCNISVPLKVKYEFTPTIFYVIKYKGLYKIGITIIDVLKRYKDDIPDRSQVEILTKETFDGYDKAYTFEQDLKDKYFKYRYFGEKIFNKTGNTEVFTENIYELYLKECADE